MKQTIEPRILNMLKDKYIWDLPFEDIVEEVYRTRSAHEYIRKTNVREYISDFNEYEIYDHTVEEVIEYLKNFDKNAKFEGEWLSEESFAFNLYNEIPESDKEYVYRLRNCFAQTEVYMNKRRQSELKDKLEKRKQQLLKELDEINSKL